MDRPRLHAGAVLGLLAIWLAVSAFNVTKAVHADDVAYLEIARQILRDPLHPMSGVLNLKDAAEPMRRVNQPPLVPYLFALVMLGFGESMVALHGLMALCALAAIVLFYALACRLAARRPLFLTTLFALGPVFIPSQNLMTDVPMLALWLAALLPLFPQAHGGPSVGKPVTSYLLSAVFISLACLVKYTSLVLIPLLVLAILLDRRWRAMWVVLIPLAVLAAWSAWNVAEFGGVHLLTRESAPLVERRPFWRGVSWLVGLGAISPFSLLGIPSLRRRRDGMAALALAAAVALASFAWYKVRVGDPLSYSLLVSLFLGNGLLVGFGTLYALAGGPGGGTHPIRDLWAPRRRLLLAAWLVGAGSFLAVWAPFVAVRHYLPLVPPILLLLGTGAAPHVGRAWRAATLAATVLLGGVIGLSDWLYADAFRACIPRIQAATALDGRSRTVWHLGHWGWAWYANQAGMRQYDAARSILATGDLVVVPELLYKQHVPAAVDRRLVKRSTVVIRGTLGTLVRTQGGRPMGGLQLFSWRSLPWLISREPLETFTVYEVGPPASAPQPEGERR